MTTITTDMLKFIACTLGVDKNDLLRILQREYCTRIDDTPADTQEQDMATMTITQEQFEAACQKAYPFELEHERMAAFVAALGITIAPAEPPAEMVRLVAYVVQQAIGKQQIAPSERSVQDMEAGALAMAQHAVDVVKKRRGSAGSPAAYDALTAILTALGAA